MDAERRARHLYAQAQSVTVKGLMPWPQDVREIGNYLRDELVPALQAVDAFAHLFLTEPPVFYSPRSGYDLRRIGQ